MWPLSTVDLPLGLLFRRSRAARTKNNVFERSPISNRVEQAKRVHKLLLHPCIPGEKLLLLGLQEVLQHALSHPLRSLLARFFLFDVLRRTGVVLQAFGEALTRMDA